MVITTTSISFILLSFGLAFCGWRFWRAFGKSGDGKNNRKIGFLIATYFALFAFANSIIGLGTLFFAENSYILFYVLVVTHLFLMFVTIFGVYAVYYIFFPLKSPWLAVFLVFILGLSAIILTFATHPQPFITPANGIEWNMSLPLSLVLFFLLSISIGSSLYIFMRLFFSVKNNEIKVLSAVLVVAAVIGISDAFVRFVLLYNYVADIRTHIYDIGIGLIGVVFIVVFVLFTNRKSFPNRK